MLSVKGKVHTWVISIDYSYTLPYMYNDRARPVILLLQNSLLILCILTINILLSDAFHAVLVHETMYTSFSS